MHSPALADQLRLLLPLPDDAPVFATRSFSDWVSPPRRWPPDSPGIVLADTRDPEGRAYVRRVPAGAAPRSLAQLVLAGEGAPGSPLRRALRRLRYPGTRRLPERRVRPALEGAGHLLRLGFEDGRHVPADFRLDRPGSTGAALLCATAAPFTGPLWDTLRNEFGALTPTGVQLRVRGATVVMSDAPGQPVVIRLVPRGGPRDVVERNHTTLQRLRSRLAGQSALLDLVPRPLLLRVEHGTLMLAESRLPGTLAWRAALARPELRETLYAEATGFLDRLGSATVVTDHDRVGQLFEHDRRRLEEADFVDGATRAILERILASAEDVLRSSPPELRTSHGDFGYGNLLVDADTGRLQGVIDWDTCRLADLPGMDRVNLEIQILGLPLPEAVVRVWEEQSARPSLEGRGGERRIRALFAMGVARFVLRALTYPALYRERAVEFRRALTWTDAL